MTNADGSNTQRLTDKHTGVRCPSWSPDGKSIVLLSTRRGDKDLIFVEPEGGRTRRLTDLPSTGMVGCPAWSPDITRLSLVQGPADPAVLIVDPTRPGADQRIERLPAHPLGTFYPRAWSPDGTRLSGTIGATFVLYDTRTRHPSSVRLASRSSAPRRWTGSPTTGGCWRSPVGNLSSSSTRSPASGGGLSPLPDVLRAFGLSAARRELYVSRGPDEADIWIATIQTQ